MRVMLIVLSILVAFAIGSYAEAQTYPWLQRFALIHLSSSTKAGDDAFLSRRTSALIPITLTISM